LRRSLAASLALLLALPVAAQPGGTILVTLDRTALVPYGHLNITYSVFDQAGSPAPGEGVLSVTLVNEDHRENWSFSAPPEGSVSLELGPAPTGEYDLWVNYSGEVQASFRTVVHVGPLVVSVDAPQAPAVGEVCEVSVSTLVVVGDREYPFPGARVVFEVLLGGELLQREGFRTGPDGQYRMAWTPPSGASVGDVLTLRAYSVDPPSPAWEGHLLLAPQGEGPRLLVGDPEPLAGTSVQVTVDLGNSEALHGSLNFLTYRLLHGDTPLLAGLSKNTTFELSLPEGFYGNATLEVVLHFGGGVQETLSTPVRVRWCELRILPPSGAVHPGTLDLEVEYSSPFPGTPRALAEVDVDGEVRRLTVTAPGRLSVDVPEGARRVVVTVTAYLSGRSALAVAEYWVSSPPPQFSLTTTSLIPGVITSRDRLWLVLGSSGYFAYTVFLNDTPISGGFISGPTVRELEVPENGTGILTVSLGNATRSLYLVPGSVGVRAVQRSKLLQVEVTGARGDRVEIVVYTDSPTAPRSFSAQAGNETVKMELEVSGARLVVAYVLSGGKILDAGAAYVTPYSRLKYEILYAAGALLVLIALLWWFVERRGP